MGEELHSINSMKNMEVIEISTGTKLGYISDLKIDTNTNTVLSLILPSEVKSWFCKEDYIEIPWSDIQIIGKDVILIKASKTLFEENE